MFKIIEHDWSTRDISISQEPESVGLVVTSPPYKDVDGYNEYSMQKAFITCHRLLKPNSLMFVNMGYLQEDFHRPFRLAALIEKIGFKSRDTFIWVKNHYKPLPGKKRVNNLYEFIFMFSKGDDFELDRLAVGVPYKDKTNAKRFAGGRDLKCAGNVWYINYPTIQKSADKIHHDMFPVELPTRCIKISGVKNDLIFDPFSGSGTTGEAALRTGNHYLGVDRNPQWVDHGLKRLSKISV